MDQSRGPRLEGIGVTVKRRRSMTSRRPKPEAQACPDRSPKSSTPVSDDTSRVSSDENMGDGKSGGKMFNLNHCVSRSLPLNVSEVGSNVAQSDGTGSESKLKKVKLKVGGMMRTIQPNTGSNGVSDHIFSVKNNHLCDNRPQQILTTKESSDVYSSPPTEKKSGLQGIPWKDFSRGSFGLGREQMGRASTRNVFDKQGDKSDAVRKSKRAPKRRVVDDGFDEDDEDDEIRYLEKLKTSKITAHKESEAQSAKKVRSGDNDYEAEEGYLSDGEPKGKKKRKQEKDLSELPTENKREMALTTRQKALLNRDSASASGANQIEFPNGLPPAPPRKAKEKMSEYEQQMKKSEAAEKRKLQNEKAAREIEAEAIRKILGQDSSRKKREEKMRKRQEELAQEKVATAQMLASNTIRTIMGPSGTTVTFPRDMGLPKIFYPKPCSYPPPREKCAGPSCTKPYKYRDAKSKLPLCSLECYKAVNYNVQS